jgi:DNA mismatch repair protein MSH6
MASKRPAGALGSDKKKQLKQGNLFSFFTKKGKGSPPPVCSSQCSLVAAPAVKNKPKNETLNSDWDKIEIGSRVAVYWPDDDTFYNATVTKVQSDRSKFYLEYDDGQCEFVDLRNERFKLLQVSSEKKRKQGTTVPPAKRLFSDKKSAKKDAEETEFDDEVSATDESDYVQGPDDEEQDDDEGGVDDQWMVSDDDEDVDDASRKRIKKAVKVTVHETACTKTSRVTPSATKQPYSKDTSPLQTPMRVSQNSSAIKNSFSHLKSGSNTEGSNTSKATVTPTHHNLTPSPPTRVGEGGPIPFVKGAANPAGSHLHNHLKFLQSPRDAQGRAKDHPDYDHRTLRVDFRELSTHNDNKPVTAAVKQWWDLKSQYFDTVLLFKTGALTLNIF